MKKICFVSLVVLLTVFASCQKDEESQVINPNAQSGQIVSDGLSYSYKNVVINPNLITLNEENATLISSPEELEQGIIKLSGISSELNSKFAPDAILSLEFADYTANRKVENFNESGSEFTLQTIEAQLGEIIEEGTFDLTLDLYQASLATDNKIVKVKSNKAVTIPLIQLMQDYNLGNGLIFNPMTDVKMLIHLTIDIKFLKTNIKTIFELQSNINPTLTFASSWNGEWNTELMQFAPQALIDYINTLEYELVKLPLLGNVVLSVKDISIPLKIETLLSQESIFTFGVNGSIKMGYEIETKGLKITKKPIFSNTMQLSALAATHLHGEVNTYLDIIVNPNVKIFINAFETGGEVSFSLNTQNVGNLYVPSMGYNYGSKGMLQSKVNVYATLPWPIGKQSINLVNTTQELWKIGAIN